MKGSCFCNEVSFEIDVEKVDAYHCHCSICRKVTGSTFNTAFTVPAKSFRWTGRTDGIRTFQRNGKGYRHEFCGKCGCTVPNRYRETKFWVPAGLLDDDVGVEVTKHIFVESKAKWDEITDDLEQFEGYP